MDAPQRPTLFDLAYKTALAYAFFSFVAQTAAVDASLIARGLVIPSLNPLVLRVLLPRPGLGLLADLAIGAALGLVLYRFRGSILNHRLGILIGFGILALVSLLITAGPALGMRVSAAAVLRTYLVYLVRDLLTILLVFYWARPPRKPLLDWIVYLLIAFFIAASLLLSIGPV